MTAKMFLILDPIKGESQDDTYKDKIDVLAWHWGMNHGGTASPGGGMATGKVHINDLSLTKYIDAASPDLMKACCTSKRFKQGQLIVRKPGEKPLDYLVVTLADVTVAAVTDGGSVSDDRFTETITLNFTKVQVKYTQQQDTGAPGAVSELCWDIKANKEC